MASPTRAALQQAALHRERPTAPGERQDPAPEAPGAEPRRPGGRRGPRPTTTAEAAGAGAKTTTTTRHKTPPSPSAGTIHGARPPGVGARAREGTRERSDPLRREDGALGCRGPRHHLSPAPGTPGAPRSEAKRSGVQPPRGRALTHPAVRRRGSADDRRVGRSERALRRSELHRIDVAAAATLAVYDQAPVRWIELMEAMAAEAARDPDSQRPQRQHSR